MEVFFLIHGGYSYNVEGPFLDFDEAARCRDNLKLGVTHSKIQKIDAFPSSITLNGRTRNLVPEQV